MAIFVSVRSRYSVEIIAEPTGSSDGQELRVPIRSLPALIKKLEKAEREHAKKYPKEANDAK